MPEPNDRVTYISQQLADAQLEASRLDDTIDVTMCVGPPWCLLEREDAEEYMSDGCEICDHYTVLPDGTFTFIKSKSISNFGNN